MSFAPGNAPAPPAAAPPDFAVFVEFVESFVDEVEEEDAPEHSGEQPRGQHTLNNRVS